MDTPTSPPAQSTVSPDDLHARPVHDLIVRVADRGPSTRALAIFSVVGVSFAVLALIAMPVRKSAPLNQPVAASQPQPTTTPTFAPVAAVERPVTPSLPSRAMTSNAPDTSFRAAPPTQGPAFAPAVAAVSRINTPPAEMPARVVNAPGVPDSPRGDLMPVGATTRAPIDLLAAPAPPSHERESSGGAAIVPVVSATRDEAPAPKAAVEHRAEPATTSSTAE